MKNIKIEEILLLIKNQVPGPYILKYWNLDADNPAIPEVVEGMFIQSDHPDKEKIECFLNTDIALPFPVDFKYDSGDIERFNNDHYQFSLYRK